MGKRAKSVFILLVLTLLLGGIFVTARAAFLHHGAQRAKLHLGLERYGTPQALADFSFLDETGARRSLKDWRGTALVVNFWGTWCPPCRREMPSLDRLQVTFAGKNIRVITIHLDRPGSTRPALWLAQQKLAHLPAFHGDSRALLGAVHSAVAPTTLILNRQGQELARIRGGADWDDERLRVLTAWAARQ